MRSLLRHWAISTVAWGAVLSLGTTALAGALNHPEDPDAWVSPKGVEEGKTLDPEEPFEMTLHLDAAPNETYSLEIVYDGDAGECAGAPALVELGTNPEGKATWTCDFETAAAEGDGSVTFTVKDSDGNTVDEVVALLSVREPEEEEEEIEETEVEPLQEDGEGANHGHCVSHWAHQANEAGLKGEFRRDFLTPIAQDPAAVAEKDSPGEDCDFETELADAVAAQEAAGEDAPGGKANKPEAAGHSKQQK